MSIQLLKSKYSFIFLICLIWQSPIHETKGQNASFEQGMTYYEQGHHLNSMLAFSSALSNIYLLSGKELCLSHLYRAKSIIEKYKQAIGTQDTLFLTQFPEILLTANEDLVQTLKFDNGKFKKEVIKTQLKLDLTLKDYGNLVTKRIMASWKTDKENGWNLPIIEAQIAMLDSSEAQQSFKTKDILGMIQYQQGKLDLARANFQMASKLFEALDLKESNMNRYYSEYYAALISYQKIDEVENTIMTVKRTEKILHGMNNEVMHDDFLKVSLIEKLDKLEFQLKLLMH